MNELVISSPVAPIHKDEASRVAIQQLESDLRELAVNQFVNEQDCPLAHVFAPGAYARTIAIPRQTLLVGKIHKHAHLNMLMEGTVCVATEEGPVVLHAPKVFVSKAGTKRVIYSVTDVIWTTVHMTQETDLDKIEAEVIAPSYEAFDASQDPDILQLIPYLREKESPCHSSQ